MTGPAPLTAANLRILDLLNAGVPVPRVVEIGARDGSWRPADVQAVIASYLAKPTSHRRPQPEQAGPARPWQPPTIPARVREPRITIREAEILSALCLGCTNRQIAARLHLTEPVVERRVLRMLAKLGAPSRLHAIALAMSGQVRIVVQAERKAG